MTAVLGDLAPIGGSPEQVFYDDGTHGDLTAGDGTYTYIATVAKGTKAKLYALNVTAIDEVGKEGSGSISLSVTDKLSGTVQPSQSVSQNFDNALGGQTLNIHFDLTKVVSSLKALKAECQIQLTIHGPDGSAIRSLFRHRLHRCQHPERACGAMGVCHHQPVYVRPFLRDRNQRQRDRSACGPRAGRAYGSGCQGGQLSIVIRAAPR